MKKFLIAAFLFAAFSVNAQNTRVETKTLISRDSFNLDGIFRKTFPGGGSVTGGVVSWVSGLTFAVTSAEYQIKNKVYKSQSGTITLDAANVSLPRIDVIGLNTSGQIIKITGTAAASPAIPQIDPATQVYLTAVFVGAGATTPGGVTALQVYDEDTEFSHTSSFPATNFASTSNVQQGSKSILVTGSNANDVSASGGLKFFNGSNVYTYSNYNVLRFYIRLSQAFTASASLQVGAGNGGEPLATVTAANGFDPSLVGVYQNISVPFSQIPKFTNTFSTVYITVTGNGKTFNVDNISLQGGVGGGTGNGYVTNVFRKPGTDSVFQTINGVNIYAYKDSTGGGGGGGITSLNAQTGGTQTFATGNSGTDFTISSSGNVHTFNLPDAGASARGVLNTYSQAIQGSKSFLSTMNIASVTPSNAITGLNIRQDVAGYSGLNIENTLASALAAPTITFVNNGLFSTRSGISKNSSTKTDYGGASSFNFINVANEPIVFNTSNTPRLIISGTGQLSYAANYGISTSLTIPHQAAVDSMIKKLLADSGFAVVRPVVNGTQSLFNIINSTKLQIRDVKNSATVTWSVDADSNLVANATGSIGGTIAANQVAYASASNTLAGNNNFYTNGSAVSIGTTDLSKTWQLRTNSGGDAFKMHSTDAICDIIGSSSTSAFEGSNRIRFENGFRFIANSADAMKVKENTNIKFYGGVEYAGKQDITTGTATTIADNVYNIYVNPASVLASHTITMPANMQEGQEVNIFFGGTIAAGSPVVTTLTIAANTGQTLYQALTPTTASGGDVLTYVYNATTGLVYRKK